MVSPLLFLVVEQFFLPSGGVCDPGIVAVGNFQHHKARQDFREVSSAVIFFVSGD